MAETLTEQKRAFGRPMPKYVPCKKTADGKHVFERLKRNQFEKCMHCGEPRFALVERKRDPSDEQFGELLWNELHPSGEQR